MNVQRPPSPRSAAQRIVAFGLGLAWIAACVPAAPPATPSPPPTALVAEKAVPQLSVEEQELSLAIANRADQLARPRAAVAETRHRGPGDPDGLAAAVSSQRPGAGYLPSRFGLSSTIYGHLGRPERRGQLKEGIDPWTTPGCSDAASGALSLNKPECKAAFIGRYGAGVLDSGISFSCGNELTNTFAAMLESLCQVEPAYFGHDGTGFDCRPSRREVTDAAAVCDGAGPNAGRPGLPREWALKVGPGVPERCVDLRTFRADKPTPYATVAPIWGFQMWVCNKPGGAPPPARCGDGKVDAGETCATCPADAGACPPPAGAEAIEISCGAPGEFRVTWKRPPAPGTVAFEQTFKPGLPSTGQLRLQVSAPGSAGVPITCPPSP